MANYDSYLPSILEGVLPSGIETMHKGGQMLNTSAEHSNEQEHEGFHKHENYNFPTQGRANKESRRMFEFNGFR